MKKQLSASFALTTIRPHIVCFNNTHLYNSYPTRFKKPFIQSLIGFMNPFVQRSYSYFSKTLRIYLYEEGGKKMYLLQERVRMRVSLTFADYPPPTINSYWP